jgi:hypothetical protein
MTQIQLGFSCRRLLNIYAHVWLSFLISMCIADLSCVPNRNLSLKLPQYTLGFAEEIKDTQLHNRCMRKTKAAVSSVKKRKPEAAAHVDRPNEVVEALRDKLQFAEQCYGALSTTNLQLRGEVERLTKLRQLQLQTRGTFISDTTLTEVCRPPEQDPIDEVEVRVRSVLSMPFTPTTIPHTPLVFRQYTVESIVRTRYSTVCNGRGRERQYLVKWKVN